MSLAELNSEVRYLGQHERLAGVMKVLVDAIST
jgi:hypothetical protein